jgi:hypothetical protein
VLRARCARRSVPQVIVDAYNLSGDDFAALRTILRELADSLG